MRKKKCEMLSKDHPLCRTTVINMAFCPQHIVAVEFQDKVGLVFVSHIGCGVFIELSTLSTSTVFLLQVQMLMILVGSEKVINCNRCRLTVFLVTPKQVDRKISRKPLCL